MSVLAKEPGGTSSLCGGAIYFVNGHGSQNKVLLENAQSDNGITINGKLINGRPATQLDSCYEILQKLYTNFLKLEHVKNKETGGTPEELLKRLLEMDICYAPRISEPDILAPVVSRIILGDKKNGNFSELTLGGKSVSSRQLSILTLLAWAKNYLPRAKSNMIQRPENALTEFLQSFVRLNRMDREMHFYTFALDYMIYTLDIKQKNPQIKDAKLKRETETALRRLTNYQEWEYPYLHHWCDFLKFDGNTGTKFNPVKSAKINKLFVTETPYTVLFDGKNYEFEQGSHTTLFLQFYDEFSLNDNTGDIPYQGLQFIDLDDLTKLSELDNRGHSREYFFKSFDLKNNISDSDIDTNKVTTFYDYVNLMCLLNLKRGTIDSMVLLLRFAAMGHKIVGITSSACAKHNDANIAHNVDKQDTQEVSVFSQEVQVQAELEDEYSEPEALDVPGGQIVNSFTLNEGVTNLPFNLPIEPGSDLINSVDRHARSRLTAYIEYIQYNIPVFQTLDVRVANYVKRVFYNFQTEFREFWRFKKPETIKFIPDYAITDEQLPLAEYLIRVNLKSKKITEPEDREEGSPAKYSKKNYVQFPGGKRKTKAKTKKKTPKRRSKKLNTFRRRA